METFGQEFCYNKVMGKCLNCQATIKGQPEPREKFCASCGRIPAPRQSLRPNKSQKK